MNIALRTDYFGNDVSRVCHYAEAFGVKDIYAFPPIEQCYDAHGLMTPQLLEDYARAFRARGLALRMLSEVIHDQDIESNKGVEKHARRLSATLSAMSEVGIDSLFIFLAARRPDEESVREQRWRNLITLYQDLVPRAEEAGIRLSNHGHQNRDRLLFHSSDMARLLDSFPSPANGVTLCMGCHALAGDDPIRLVHEFGDRIVSVHARDVVRAPEPRDVRLGTGIVDVRGVLRALQSIGFDGPICPEHMPPIKRDSNEESAFGWAVGYLTACLTEVSVKHRDLPFVQKANGTCIAGL